MVATNRLFDDVDDIATVPAAPAAPRRARRRRRPGRPLPFPPAPRRPVDGDGAALLPDERAWLEAEGHHRLAWGYVERFGYRCSLPHEEQVEICLAKIPMLVSRYEYRLAKFSTYCYRAFWNELRRVAETTARKVLHSLPDDYEPVESRHMNAREDIPDVEEALKKLSSRQRRVVRLWFGVGRRAAVPPAEIAVRMKLTAKQVKVLLRQALAEIRVLMGAEGGK
jgi:RNA polymerase sigma factor (sigma-70 family)